MPPSIQSNVLVNHTYRFKGTSPSFTFLARDLARLCGVVSTTTTVGYPLAQTFKLNRVEVWATTQSNFSSQITLRWASDEAFANSTKEITDMSLSSAYPSHIVAHPAPGTYQSMWFQESTGGDTEFFHLDAATNVIVDINITFIMYDGNRGASVTIADATAGTIYYPSPNSSLTPVGLTGILFA